MVLDKVIQIQHICLSLHLKCFFLIKTNNDNQGIEILNHEFLCTAYADDTTFFMKDLNSVKVILSSLDQFYTFSGLRPNLSKCEIAGIGVLKDENMALCGLKSVNLKKETIKILGVHLSYNEKLQNELGFCATIKNICNVIKLWQMRHLYLEGKITTFKLLAISKIVYLALFTIVPKNVIFELKEIQNKFLWSNKKSKIKHSTLCNDYKNGGLKNVDIELKIISVKCSWICRLYNEVDHDWKIIPLNYTPNTLGKNFTFHSNLSIPNKTLIPLPPFYKDIIKYWCFSFFCSANVPSSISSQCFWYNSCLKIDKKPFFYKEFSNKNINYVSNLFSNFGEIKSWEKVMDEFNLDKKFYFKWYQIIHTIPLSWKLTLLNDNGNCQNLEYLSHHLIKNNQILALEKLIPKELYSLSIFLKTEIPTSQKYFIRPFPNLECDWKDICLLPHKVTIDTTLLIFQYKLLSSILYLNKHLFMFRKIILHLLFKRLQNFHLQP